MWFFTEFLERYTRNIARSIVRVATAEVEANRRVLANAFSREQINRLILPERDLTVPPAFVAERRAVHGAEVAPPELAHAGGALDVAKADAALRDADEAKVAKTLIALDELPVGVRGDLVLKYVEAFAAAPAVEAAALIDKLSRDKKVRVAELQIISAQVLGEAVTRRTKSGHYDAIREHLMPQDGAGMDEAAERAVAHDTVRHLVRPAAPDLHIN